MTFNRSPALLRSAGGWADTHPREGGDVLHCESQHLGQVGEGVGAPAHCDGCASGCRRRGDGRCLQASGVLMSAERQSAQGGKTVKRLSKIKTPTMRWSVQTKEEVDDAIRRIGQLQRECSRIEAAMNDELAAVKKSYEQKAEHRHPRRQSSRWARFVGESALQRSWYEERMR